MKGLVGSPGPNTIDYRKSSNNALYERYQATIDGIRQNNNLTVAVNKAERDARMQIKLDKNSLMLERPKNKVYPIYTPNRKLPKLFQLNTQNSSPNARSK